LDIVQQRLHAADYRRQRQRRERLNTVRSQTLTATDTDASISGVSGTIAVLQYGKCDTNQDGKVNVVNVVDVQIVINAALGLGCTAKWSGEGTGGAEWNRAGGSRRSVETVRAPTELLKRIWLKPRPSPPDRGPRVHDIKVGDSGGQ
jgi:hypothetical protein